MSELESTSLGAEQMQLPRAANPTDSGELTPVASKPLMSSSGTSLQARADHAMARALPMLRYRLRHFGWSGIAGAASVLLAVVMGIALLVPAHQSIAVLGQEMLATSYSAPLPASQTLSPRQFATSLPSRGQVPALLNTVLEQAKQTGIVLEQGKYTFVPATGNRLARYSFEFPIKAEYGHIRTFINSTLSVIPSLGLEKLHIERKNVGDTVVNADVGFIIYLRSSGT